MKLCPHCHHNELTGALFCSECGSKLVFREALSFPASLGVQSETQKTGLGRDSTIPPKVALEVLNVGKVLPIVGEGEATVGRFNMGQSLIPDIDLTPFGALDAGVSRFHASVIVKKDGIALVDLDSINGTFVNGNRISPNVDWPLKNGDIVDMGELRLQILIER